MVGVEAGSGGSAAWHAGDVTVDDLRLHYYRTGGGGPIVVLLHGFSDSGRCWSHVARALEPAFDVVMPDARGHGHSEVGQVLSRDRLVQDVAGLITRMGLAPAAVVGHSMGAATAASLAANYPDLVRGLVLEDPPWWDGAISHASPDRERHMQRTSGSRDHLVTACRAEHPHWAEEEVQTCVEAKLQLDVRWFEPGALDSVTEWRKIVPWIQTSVLLITGDPNRGAIVTPEVAAEAARWWSDGRIVRLPGAGHGVHRDAFGRYVETVVEFLRLA